MISEKIVMVSVSEPGRNCNGLATNSKMEMGRSHLFINNHNSKKRRWTLMVLLWNDSEFADR